MIAHVIDDLFDPQFLVKLESEILNKVPVYSTNIANRTSYPYGFKGSHRLLGADIFVREGHNRVDTLHPSAGIFFDAFEIIENNIFDCPIFLHRIDINLQCYGQDGAGHTDGSNDSEVTIMIMNNLQWKPEWGGQFQIVDEVNGNNVLEEHAYIPGRLLIFPGNHPHRGLAPLDRYAYRYTTVFRCSIDEDIDVFVENYFNSRKLK